MPAPDSIRLPVRNALIKDGWTITDEELTLLFEGIKLQVDLAAERLIALERGTEKFAVEIKTFGQPSFVYELYLAIGQFINYSTALRHKDPDRNLFLAVSKGIYDGFFTQKGVQTIISENHIRIIVVDLATEEVIR